MAVTSKLLIILDKTDRRRLVVVLVGTLIAGVLEMIGIGSIPAFVGLLVDPEWLSTILPGRQLTNWAQEIERPRLLLLGASILGAGFLFKNLYIVALIYGETRLAQSLAASISNRLFRAYLHSPYHFHLQRNPADLIRNLTEEALYAMQFVRAGTRLMREGLVLALVFLLMILVEPAVSLTVFSLLALVSGCFYGAVRRVLTRRGQLCKNHWSRRIQVITQTLGAIKDAKILGCESYLMKLFGVETEGIQRHQTFYEVASALPRYFLETLAMAAVIPIAGAFVLFERPLGGLLPILALFGVAVMRLVPAMTTINASLVEIRYRRSAFDSVAAELKALEIPLRTKERVPIERPRKRMRESISLKNVQYTYPGSTHEALWDISLTIQAGMVVGFVGTSGAGKSTLIDVILGLLAPTAGRVLVDGVDVHEDLPAWQRQIGYVPQTIYLIDDSIRRNIAFGVPDDEIDDVAVTRAVQAVQIESLVRSLPQGLDTLVGHEGVRLSGGQRQRLAIARALYHDPSVLVMDEATNALDDNTESDIMEAVRALQKDKTLIIVAHRPSTVEGCDQLFRLEGGRLVHEQQLAAAG